MVWLSMIGHATVTYWSCLPLRPVQPNLIHPMATDAPAPYEYQPYPFDGTWDPDALPAARAPSRLCLSRLKKELDMMRRDPPPGIFLEQDGELVTRLHAVVVGPQGTPYEVGDCRDDFNPLS